MDDDGAAPAIVRLSLWRLCVAALKGCVHRRGRAAWAGTVSSPPLFAAVGISQDRPFEQALSSA